MFPVALRVLPIKDLKDLSVFGGRGYYRHAGPKGPEEVFSRERSRGTGPRATGQGGVLLSMRAVRDRAILNYGLLLIVIIVIILLKSCPIF